jgi:hypothetical protein
MKRKSLPFVSLGKKGWERLADASALLALVLVIVASGFAVYFYYGVDFRAFYAAASVVLAGGDPYDYRQIAAVLEEKTGYVGGTAYYHPPWVCLMMAPLALLPLEIARGAWIVVNWGLFIGGLVLGFEALGWRVRGWRRWLMWLSAFVLFGWVCLKFEQFGIFLFFCLAWALYALQRGKNVQAGLAMALLLSKPNATFLAFVYLVIFSRRTHRQATIWALIWLGLLAGVGTLLVPGWLTRLFQPDFWVGLIWLQDGPDRVLHQRRLCTLLHRLQGWGITGATAWFLYGVLAVTGVTLAWRSSWLRANRVYGASLGIALTLLLTPYALLYDYVPLVMGQLWVYKRLSHGATGTRRWLAIALLAFMFSVLFWAGPEYDGYWLVLGMWGLLILLAVGPGEPCWTEGPLVVPSVGSSLE